MTEPASPRARGADEREFLRRSLDDLERERAAGDLADDDYHDLKARYEAKLRAVGQVPVESTTIDPMPRRRWARTIAAVALVAVVGVGGGLAVAASSGSRRPGEQLSGRTLTSDQERMAEAGAKFRAGDAAGAVDIYRELLDENPDDVDALTYLGWTLRNVSLQQDDPRLLEAGIGFIEQATRVDPTHAEAWFFRGVIFLRDEDDPDKAVDALRLALANDPIPELEGAVRELLAEIAAQSS